MSISLDPVVRLWFSRVHARPGIRFGDMEYIGVLAFEGPYVGDLARFSRTDIGPWRFIANPDATNAAFRERTGGVRFDTMAIAQSWLSRAYSLRNKSVATLEDPPGASDC